MGTYSLGQGNFVTVYAYQAGIYLRRWSGQYMGRPQLLAGDFRECLTDVFWRDTVYYGYQSQKGEYLVRDASQPDKKYRLQQRENSRICSPRLVLYRDRLVVFYIEEKEWESGCRIQGIFLGEKKEFGLPEQYPGRAEFQVMICGEELFVGVCFHREWKYYRFFCGNTWEEMGVWDYWRKKKQMELEEQCRNKEELEMLQQELQYRNQLIESIKAQYEELMDTASKYRDEAKKWRDQYVAACGGKAVSFHQKM